jgi:hypothetical protein
MHRVAFGVMSRSLLVVSVSSDLSLRLSRQHAFGHVPCDPLGARSTAHPRPRPSGKVDKSGKHLTGKRSNFDR